MLAPHLTQSTPPCIYLQLIFKLNTPPQMYCGCNNSIKQPVRALLLAVNCTWVKHKKTWGTVAYGQGKRNGMAKNEALCCPRGGGVSESCRAHHLTPMHSSSALQTIWTEFQNCIKTSLKALSQEGMSGHCVIGIILHLQQDNCKWCH